MNEVADRFTLELPPEPAYVGTARMFVSTLARHFEVSDEVIEDLKLAISEACSRALASEAGLTIRAWREDGRLRFEVGQGDAEATGKGEVDAALSLELIGALFEDAEIAPSPAGSVLRFSTG